MVEKPLPNEHACRISDPDKYVRIRRVNCAQRHEDKCIDVLYGVIEVDGKEKTEIQALRYNKDVWAKDDAEKHCKGRGGSFEPAEIIEELFNSVECKIKEEN